MLGNFLYLWLMNSLKVLKASAGAGKTFRIVAEILQTLFQGIAPKQIVALTFTRKATAEIRNRIVADLQNILKAESPQELREKFPDTYEKVKNLDFRKLREKTPEILVNFLFEFFRSPVSTIDSFLIRLFFTYALLLELDNSIEIQDEIPKQKFVKQAIDKILKQANEHPQQKEFIEHLSNLLIEDFEGEKGKIPYNFKDLIDKITAYHNKVSAKYLNFPPENSENFLLELQEELRTEISKTEENFLNLFKEEERPAYEYACKNSDFFKRKSQNPVYKILSDYLQLQDPRTFIRKYLPLSKAPLKYASESYIIKSNAPREVHSLRERLISFFNKEYFKYVLLNSLQTSLINSNYLPLLLYKNFLEAYYQTSERDVQWINKTLNEMLCEAGKGLPPFEQVVLAESSIGKVSAMLLDEFQDTSRFQYQILKALMQELRSNTVVGDIKQSIYRWRNAEPSIMASQIYKDFQCKEFELPNNFRSHKKIVEFNNLIYSSIAKTVKELQDANADLPEEVLAQLKPFAEFSPQIPVSEQQGNFRVYLLEGKNFHLNEYKIFIAETVATQIKMLVEKKQYAYSDFMLLVRNGNEGKLLKEILQKQGLPVVTTTQSLSLKDFVNNRFFIAFFKELLAYDPEPLRNQYYLLKDFQIIREGYKEKTFLHSEAIKSLPELREWLQELRPKLKNGFPVIDLLEFLLRKFKEHNIPFVYDKAFAVFYEELNRFIAKHGNSLRKFLEFWETELGNLTLEDEKARNSIEILTVHKAKGLEKKVVFIPFWESLFKTKDNLFTFPASAFSDVFSASEEFADFPLSVKLNKSQRELLKGAASLKISKFLRAYEIERHAENLSLAYVATTRPKESLFIYCGYSENKENFKKYSVIFRNSIGNFKSLKNIGAEVFDEFPFPEKLEELNANTNTENRKPSISGVTVVSYGKFQNQGATKREQENVTEDLHTYSYEWRDRLKLLLPETELATPEQILGTYIHKILHNFVFNPEVLEENSYEGKTAQLLNNFKELLQRNLPNGEKLRTLFSKDYRQFPEKVIKKDANLFRPDLLAISKDEVFILDYKISEKTYEEHIEQIRKYKQILSEIYPPKKIFAILVYLERKELIEC